MATLGALEEDKDPGIFRADIWQPTVLTVFCKEFDPELAHCPILAATEGLSCDIPNPALKSYLDETKPIFIPEGELTCSTIALAANQTTYRAFLLPKICSPPLGMAWPATIGTDAFVDSITALGKAYKPFLHCIEALTPAALTAWFPAVAATPEAFAIKGCKNTELLEPHLILVFSSVGPCMRKSSTHAQIFTAGPSSDSRMKL
jgi:hypothetical protein